MSCSGERGEREVGEVRWVAVFVFICSDWEIQLHCWHKHSLSPQPWVRQGLQTWEKHFSITRCCEEAEGEICRLRRHWNILLFIAVQRRCWGREIISITRQCVMQCGKCWHQPGRRRHRPRHTVSSLSGTAGGDTCQFTEDQAGINILRDDPLPHPHLSPPADRPLPVRRGQTGPLQIRLPLPPLTPRLGLGLGHHQPSLSSQHQGQGGTKCSALVGNYRKQLWCF